MRSEAVAARLDLIQLLQSKSEDLMDVDSPAGEFRHSMTIGTVTYIGMAGYEQGHGYWGPYVRKHGFFNVTLFEKLNPNRKLRRTRALCLFWHISAPKRMVQ